MKKIIVIKSQEEFDKIKKVEADEEVVWETDNKIKINCILEVLGILRLKGIIESSWQDKYILNRDKGEIYIVSRDSSQNHIDSRDSSQNHIVSRDSSQNHIYSWDSSQNHIVSGGSSQNHIVSWGSSQNYIDSWGSSQSHIVSWGSSQNHIGSWGSSQNHIDSRDSSVNTVFNAIKSLTMHSFSVAIIPFDLKIKIKKEKTCIVQRYKSENYLSCNSCVGVD